MTEENYPGVFIRVKAVVTDSGVLLLFMLAAYSIFGLFEDVHDYARLAAFVFIFVLYDPLFTSTFGGTIGHMIFGIRVKRENKPERNILFHLAIIRFIVKALLGWISLITVSTNKKCKAIHDMLVGSVVVFEK